MSEWVKAVDSQNFDAEVLKGQPLLVLIDFWAPWCGPCRSLAPYLEKLAQAYAGKLKVVKLDIEESPAIASEYNIRSIPTLVLVESGKEKARFQGSEWKDLIKFLDNYYASEKL